EIWSESSQPPRYVFLRDCASAANAVTDWTPALAVSGGGGAVGGADGGVALAAGDGATAGGAAATAGGGADGGVALAAGDGATAGLAGAAASGDADGGVALAAGDGATAGLAGAAASGDADGGVALAAGDGATAGLAGAVVVAGGGAAARALDVGGELPGACADVGGGAVGWASGRRSDGRSASRLQATTTTSDAARAAPPTIATVRIRRFGGRCASDQRRLRTSCMSGLSPGCLSSACVTMLSTEAGTARRGRIGGGGSVRGFSRTASRVSARNGGPP